MYNGYAVDRGSKQVEVKRERLRLGWGGRWWCTVSSQDKGGGRRRKRWKYKREETKGVVQIQK